MNTVESVPTVWDDVLDGDFFRVVAHVFSPRWLEATSLLLLTNDIDVAA